MHGNINVKFAHWSFWQEQHVDEDECAALVAWYWQAKPEVPREKPVIVLLRPPQILHGLTDLVPNPGLRRKRPATNRRSPLNTKINLKL
jgi:hypothetical protein